MSREDKPEALQAIVVGPATRPVQIANGRPRRPMWCPGAVVPDDDRGGKVMRRPCKREVHIEIREETVRDEDEYGRPREKTYSREVMLGLCEACGIDEANYRHGLRQKAQQGYEEARSGGRIAAAQRKAGGT
jgi:hypothetical protein